MLTAMLLAIGVPAPDAVRPLTFDDVLARARPSVVELQAESTLAETSRVAVTSGGLLRDGPTLTTGAGSRRDAEGATRGDVAIGAELPLVFSRSTSDALFAALERAAPVLREGARAESLLALRRAFLDAWLDERLILLRELDVTTVETWLRTSLARRDAGAEAPFQATLVEGELLRSRNELAETRAHRSESWGRLRGLADVPAMPVPLAPPLIEPAAPDGQDRSRFETGLLKQAVLARHGLEIAVAGRREALSNARWSLRADGRKEGAEEIATLGVAVRLPRAGETGAVHREAEATRRDATRQRDTALAELEARFAAALERLSTTTAGTESPIAFEAALAAVQLRLTEGKERASEALPIRRQLLEAQIANLRQAHARGLASAELSAMTAGVAP